MVSMGLRDHAQQILEAIVVDLATPQTPEAQSAKSMGLAPVAADAPETAAQTHAVLRAKSGFNIEQLASEYRALRSSVLTLWLEACLPESPMLDDVIRFNEAIDQALAESIGFFSAHVTRSRNLLLGMLSHDLRSPLQTIQMTARYLRKIDTSDDIGQAAARLVNSGARMQQLLDDLIDFNRAELGLGIRVAPVEGVDLGAVCADELDQIRAAQPGHAIELEVDGNCRGSWDPGRIQQLVNNLVVNAINYGEGGTTLVAVHGGDGEVRITVANSGQTIDPDTLEHLFEPLRRGHDRADTNQAGLGLGLYISCEIAKAHGGRISVTSERMHTVFDVHLPKQPESPASTAVTDPRL
ncbi:MAG TPA: HAMP domain-containing sensor histidine kinase [Steroidobacteraceae bacterium]|nr:HAMP domain-containing sensor histidine kinase [Steroidobacteraceae bacterium]